MSWIRFRRGAAAVVLALGLPSTTAVTASPRAAGGTVACPAPQPISITGPPP